MKLLSPQQGVYFAFCLYALSLGAIFPRLGDVQLQMGIGQDTLGMAIIGATTASPHLVEKARTSSAWFRVLAIGWIPLVEAFGIGQQVLR